MAGTVGVAPGTTTIDLGGGKTISIEDWIDDKLYASAQLVNGQTTPVETYVSGISQPIPGGTRASSRVDTNVPRSGDVGLPQSWEMYIYGLGVKVTRAMRANSSGAVTLADASGSLSNPPTLATLFQIDRVTFLEFKYNEKSYTKGVMQDYPQGHGFNVFSTNANFELAQNGVPSPRDRNALVLPIWLRENLAYKMIFSPEAPLVINQAASDGGTALTYVDVKTYAYGLIRRNVV